MPIVNGKRVLTSDPAYQATLNERGGLNKNPNPAQTSAGANLQPTVSADTLANPPAKVTPPVPQVNTNDGSRTQGLIDNVATNTQGFIQSTSENAQKRDELASLLGTQTFDSAGQRTQLNEEFGVPANLARLTDIQTQLTRANTDSNVQKTQIAGAAGQTLGQAQRELTQQDRENAVRNAGLAAEAAVLQGSIETASTLINQAMSDYYQDRQLTNQNMIQQLNYFSKLADDETQQLLKREERKYQEDQRQIIRAETAVDAALVSGYATGADIQKITALAGDPQSQAAYAQTIVANAARQKAAMERQRIAIAGANADLQRRQQLFQLAAAGDPLAIKEIGFDPNAEKNAAEAEAENKVIDAKIEEATTAEQKITNLLSNRIGLQASSGEWQFGEATLKGLTGTANQTTQTITVGGQEIQMPTTDFGISGIAKARQAKSTFLANADNLLTKEGLLEIGDLAAQDIKLTPITEKELAILFQSASTLNAASRRDEGGKLIGFSIPDTEVEKEFQQMLLSYTNVKAELAANRNLPKGTYGELENIRQGQ